MTRHVFVLGLTDRQREELDTVREDGPLEFHGLLDHEALVETEEIDFDALLERSRAELDAFDGSIDAFVTHWEMGPGPGPSYTETDHKHDWSAETGRTMAANLVAVATALRERPIPAPPG